MSVLVTPGAGPMVARTSSVERPTKEAGVGNCPPGGRPMRLDTEKIIIIIIIIIDKPTRSNAPLGGPGRS